MMTVLDHEKLDVYKVSRELSRDALLTLLRMTE
jgi:hypothetical protein